MFPAGQTTSGTFLFGPSNAEIIATAFSRIGVRRTEILAPHIQDAVAELNLLLVNMNNAGPNLAQVDLQSIPLVQGTATYSVPAETVQILDVFNRTGIGTNTVDIMVWPISRSEYAQLPNKNVQNPPTQFWFDRLISPSITLYPTPDGGGPYTLFYYRWRQIQDAQIANAQNPEIPNRWIDALVAGLAYRMARIYSPDKEQMRKMDYNDAWGQAAKQDVENTTMYIVPAFMGYYR